MWLTTSTVSETTAVKWLLEHMGKILWLWQSNSFHIWATLILVYYLPLTSDNVLQNKRWLCSWKKKTPECLCFSTAWCCKRHKTTVASVWVSPLWPTLSYDLILLCRTLQWQQSQSRVRCWALITRQRLWRPTTREVMRFWWPLTDRLWLIKEAWEH